jgi:hypothetical protein
MSNDLDAWLARLAADGGAAPAGLEAAVLESIAGRREDLLRSRRLAPYRTATVGLAMALGVTAGGMTAARATLEPQHLSSFSAEAHLAPSTLLEGRG